MPTLSEYQKLANDDVTAGVFDNIITASELAPFLQFTSFSGNSLVYNRESTLGAAATHQVGDIRKPSFFPRWLRPSPESWKTF